MIAFEAITSISSKHTALKSLNIATNASKVYGDFKFSYEDYGDYTNFINKVHIESRLDSPLLNLSDLGYFVPQLHGINQSFQVSTTVKGNVNSFIIPQLKVDFGKASSISGNLVMSGLPDIHNTFVHFDDIEIKTNNNDLSSIELPVSGANKHIELPSVIGKLGMIHFFGEYRGMINEFELNGEANTLLGQVGTSIKYTVSDYTGFKEYDGRIYTNNFDIGSFIESEEIGSITFDFDINGIGVTPNDAQANLKGDIQSISAFKL